MARNRITQAGIQLTDDNGSVLQSLAAGEQQQTEVTLKFFTNIHGAQIAVRVIEADNSKLEYFDGTPAEYPTSVQTGAQVQYLPIAYNKNKDTENVFEEQGLHVVETDSDYVTNKFKIIWDDEVIDRFIGTQPLPDKPVYAFVSVEVRDTGVGELQQIYKPIRGLLEFRYSINF